MSNSYPLLDITWTILIVFAWVLYIWVAVTCLLDIFRREMSGFAKVLWTLVIIIFRGWEMLLYLLLNPGE